MNKNIMKLLEETRNLIDYKSRIFIINTFVLGIIFIIMNFFTVTKFNLENVEEYLGRNIQVKLVLKDMLSESTVKSYEEKLITLEKVDYHSYSAKELAVKDLEKRMNLDFSQKNPLKNTMTIYTRDINSVEEVKEVINSINDPNVVEKILFNEELVGKLINAKVTMRKLKNEIVIFFTVPLFVFIFLIFKLNFINYEEELMKKYLNAEKNGYVISPYFLKKAFNIFLGWAIAYVIFGFFYGSAEKLLYGLNTSFNIILFENLPKSMFIYQLIISLIILLFSGLFIRTKGIKGGRK